MDSLGNHVKIHHNKVHHCPNSGIRVDKGDYIALEDNEIFGNTWWGSAAESAIVIAEATHIDEKDITKMFLVRNIVYDNQNNVPYYNPNYEQDEDERTMNPPDYGTSNQTYIIDGSGEY